MPNQPSASSIGVLSGRPVSKRSVRKVRHRDQLAEALESRMLLAAVSWDGGGDGTSWADPINWSNNALPTSADDVTINVAGTPTIRFTSGLSFVNSLNCSENFELSGGTLSINASSSFNSGLTLSGGTLAGAGNVSITGSATWSGGSMEGTGRTTIAATGNLNAAGTMNLYRPLDNSGTLNWNSGNFTLVNGSINNLSGGIFSASAGGSIQSGGGNNSFNNGGVFNQLGTSTTTVSPGVSFTNTVTLNVQGGNLSIYGGGVSSGTFNISANAALNLDGGHVFFASSTLTGAGNLYFAGGTNTVSGTVNTSGTITFAGSGSTTFSGNFAPTGTVNFNAGSITLNTSFTPTGTVYIGGASLTANADQSWASLNLAAGSLSGTGNITIGNNFTWSSGSMSGTGVTTIGQGATGALNSSTKLLGRRLSIAGTCTWSSGQIQMTDATIATTAGGVFNMGSSDTIQPISGTNLVDNVGTINTTSGVQNTINVNFSNTGTLNVTNGYLNINGSVTQIVNSTLTTGTWNVQNGYYLNGLPSITANSANVTIGNVPYFFGFNPATNAGTITYRNISNLTIPASNSGTINVGQGASIVSYSFANAGAVVIDSGAALYLYGNDTHTGSFVTNGNLLFGGTVFLTSASSVTGSGSATFFQAGSAGTQRVDCNITLSGGLGVSGNVRVEFNGTVQAVGGNLSTATIAGSGNLVLGGQFGWSTGAFEGTGTVTIPTGGVLTVNSTVYLRRVMTIAGTMQMNSAQIVFNNSTLSTSSTGTVTLNSSYFSQETPSVTGTISNQGLLVLNSSNIYTGVSATNAGTLRFIGSAIYGGGSSTGIIDLQGGSSATFSGGFSIGGSISGQGSIYLNSGDFNVSAAISSGILLTANSANIIFATNQTLASTTFNSSTLRGSGNVTISNFSTLSLTSSRIEGTGRLTIAPQSALTTNGSFGVARPLQILGTANIYNTQMTIEDTVVTTFATGVVNLGASTISRGANATTAAFDIAGTLNESVSYSGSTINAGVRVSNSGVWGIQNGLTIGDNSQLAGSIAVSGGSLTFAVAQTFFATSTLTINSGVVNFLTDQTILGSTDIGGQLTGNGALVFSGPLTVQGNALLDPRGDITVNNGLAWTNGYITVKGDGSNYESRLIIPSGVTVSGNSGTRTLGRGLDNSGLLSLTNGSFRYLQPHSVNPALRINTGGSMVLQTLTLQVSSPTGETPQIDVLGSTNWTSVSDGGGISGTLTVQANATATVINSNPGNLNWSILANGTMTFNNSTLSTVTNAGTLTAAGAAPRIYTSTNNGVFTLTTGTLQLDTFTNNATFTTNSGSTLTIGGFTTGQNSTQTFGGSTTISAPPAGPLAGTFTLSSTFTNNFPMNFPGTVNLTGTLAGSTVTIAGTLNWTSGTLSTQNNGRIIIAAAATFNISGSAPKTLSRPIDNLGTMNWSGGGSIAATSAVVNNFTDAVFNITANASFTRTSGIVAIQNLGTINRSGAGTTTTLGPLAAMYNAGTVNILSGTFALNGGGLHSGVFVTSSGATISFGGVHLVSGACSFDDVGTIAVTDGTFTLDGMLSEEGSILLISGGTAILNDMTPVTSIVLSGGTLTGPGDIDVTGSFMWTGGTLTGTGLLLIAPAATATITSTGGLTLGRNLRLEGASTITGGLNVLVGGVLDIAGVTTFVPAASGNTLNIAGTLLVDSAQPITIPAAFLVNNTGLIDVRSGSLTIAGTVPQITTSAQGATLTAGGYSVGDGAEMLFTGYTNLSITTIAAPASVTLGGPAAVFAGSSSLAGLTRIDGRLALKGGASLAPAPAGGVLNFAGSIQVDPGSVLSVAGDLTLSNTARITLGFDPSNALGSLGRVEASGVANLAGSLVTAKLGTADPAEVNFFAAIAAASLAGDFATTTIPGVTLPGGEAYKYTLVNDGQTLSLLFTLKADFNNDGALNADDLGDFITGYFDTPASRATDFNGDGVINSDDIADFITAYFSR